MQERLTNYVGDIEERCVFCNQPQREHFVNVGKINGETYLHHLPCEQQMDALRITKTAKSRSVPLFLRQFFIAASRSLRTEEDKP